jgi:hypothetical protein
MMEVLPPPPKVLDVSAVSFAHPDLTTFARLGDLGLVVVGQRVEPGRAALARCEAPTGRAPEERSAEPSTRHNPHGSGR